MTSETVLSDIKECHPLDAIDEVLNWRKPNETWANLVKPLQKRTDHCYQSYPVCGNNSKPHLKKASVPKTLVCHDMKGGYGADRWVNGTDNPEEYKFLVWSSIDTFVYFSHRLVTIPPLCWINAGHTHGVKVLGTLISEGECGTEIWNKLSLDETNFNKLAIHLAEICDHYGFDGYLINIENSMSYGVMQLFVSFLEQLIKKLKNINPEKTVIWYDAITYPFGKLYWQNRLNILNRKFFDICDGIFLNYGWSEEDLILSCQEAGTRKTDVYVGIDVFGRGVFGGGGFTTCEAMNVIRKQGLSAAIFAPGWVFEKCEQDEIVDNRDFMFWELLMEYLYSYGPAKLPFQTSFSRGYGLRKYKEGLILSDHPWFNLSEMNHMPALLSGIHEVEESSCLMYYQNDAFNGGGCLLIKQQNTSEDIKDHIDRLLICDFFCQKGKKMIMRVRSKPLYTGSNAGINIILNLLDHKDSDSHSEETIEKKLCLPIIFETEQVNFNQWIMSDFDVDIGCAHITSIDCMLTGDNTPVLIGYLSIEEEGIKKLQLDEKVQSTLSPNEYFSCPGISLAKSLISE